MIGQFELMSGQTLQILVGQQGLTTGNSGGGGGGTGINLVGSSQPLVVAGAGGGASTQGDPGLSGTTATSGVSSSGSGE